MKSEEFNFPSYKVFLPLIPSSERELFQNYLRYLLMLAKRLERPNMQKHYINLHKAISRQWQEQTLLGRLQTEFIAKNISLSVLLEPIDGFMRLEKNTYPLSFFEAVPILMQIISPISRMIAVLNNQHPPFYQPFANLIFGYGVLYLEASTSSRKQVQNHKISLDNTQAIVMQTHTEIKQIMSASGGLKFRLKIGFYLGLFKILTTKIYKHTKKDKINLNFSDYVNAFLYGLWQTLSHRNKVSDLNKI